MKKERKSLRSIYMARTIIPVFLLLFAASGALAGNKEDPCQKTHKIIDFVMTFHIDPPAIDAEFNQRVVKSFLEYLDPAGYLLTSGDAQKIRNNCPSLPVTDCKAHNDFIDHITTIYIHRLNTLDSLVEVITRKPFDFSLKDTLFFPDAKTVNYSMDESQLFVFWEQYLRFQTLRYFMTAFKAGDSSFVRDSEQLNRHEAELRSDIAKQEHCNIQHMLNMDGDLYQYILSAWLNAVTMTFDPHTNYFSRQEKEHFDHMLSRNKYSFGIDLDQNRNGDILIARLIPGGPAWRSNELNEGDILLSVQFAGRDALDMTCSNLYEIENLIYTSEAADATITVRNSFGQVKSVKLKMEILEAAENVVYSFIMDGKCKVGYITLPAFYTDPASVDPLGCASDLVKEIVKLREDNVEGIILDVRNNGGGSVTEAVDLAGVFIDSGPLCIYTNKTQKPTLVNDVNRGMIYDGPLVLLVNQMSASASEILAGIMQDYNRAVIVGQPTYGKASGQNILPVGDNKNGKSELFRYDSHSSDFVKVTTARYFNLQGKSHQSKGIQPDIQLPVVFSYDGYLESSSEAALTNTSVDKEVSFEPWPPLPTDSLKALHKQRMENNNTMQMIQDMGHQVEKLYTEKSAFPLEFNSFKNFYSEGLTLIRDLDSLLAKPASAYTILDNSFDANLLKHDDYKQKIHKEMIQKIDENQFIEEGYRILCDLIKIQNAENIEQ